MAGLNICGCPRAMKICSWPTVTPLAMVVRWTTRILISFSIRLEDYEIEGHFEKYLGHPTNDSSESKGYPFSKIHS
jgi:hypothetical protein